MFEDKKRLSQFFTYVIPTIGSISLVIFPDASPFPMWYPRGVTSPSWLCQTALTVIKEKKKRRTRRKDISNKIIHITQNIQWVMCLVKCRQSHRHCIGNSNSTTAVITGNTILQNGERLSVMFQTKHRTGKLSVH